MPANRILTLLILCCCALPATAQKSKAKSKFVFGDVKPEDFAPTVYPIDSAAGAIYLYDAGSSKYEGNNNGNFSVIFQKRARMRVLNKKSFDDLATVTIPLYISSDVQDKLNDFEAATYNIENGKVVVTKVDKASIFREKEEDYQLLKFTFPNIKEGSIIEYNYTVTSSNPYNLNSWKFQEEYPKLWSEYTITVPEFFDFMTFLQGHLTCEINTVENYRDNFYIVDSRTTSASRAISFSAAVIEHQWAMKAIPALKKEIYTTTINNYRSKITFQLSAIKYPDQPVQPYLQDWNSMVEKLMKREDFGENLTRDLSWLKDDIKSAAGTGGAGLALAKNIYKYVQTNYTSTDNDGIYLSQPLKKTAQQKKGEVADINMLLIAMLKLAGFETHPVILSTREHGKTYDLYPIMNRFNYVIAQVLIDDKSYLLDASGKDIGFGYLDEECYNGNARVVAPVPVLINLSADSLKERSVTYIFMKNEDNHGISGVYTAQLGQMQSLKTRQLLSKQNKEDLFKKIKKEYPADISIDNPQIDSLRSLEDPLTIKFELHTTFNEDLVYFNPMMGDAHKENPFTAAERFYPVEMPYRTDENYILNMEIPTGYTVEELPKSARINFNDTEGSFEYMIGQGDGNIQVRCHLLLNKATFEPEDYETLREFYSYIIEKENEQIVFKKIQ